MTAPLAEPISLHTRLADIDARVAVEYDVKRAPVMVFTFDERSDTTVRVHAARPELGENRYYRKVPVDQELGDIASLALREKPLRAVKLADGGTIKEGPLETVADKVFYAASAIVFLAVFIFQSWVPLLITVLLLVQGLAASLQNRLRHKLQPAKFVHKLGTVDINELTSVAARPGSPDTGAAEDVALVKEEYGGLLSDFLYRVENPALFDVAVPTTRAFTTALLRWDDTHRSLPADEAADLAVRVRLTFDAARAHAEKVGTNHAPAEAQEALRRAAGALRLAESTTNDAERAEARRQAVRILKSLALYYLPDEGEAQTMLGGGQLRALPGRRSEPT